MSNLKDDIQYVDSIFNEECDDEFGFIYSRTNEDLVELFKRINVKDKDVYANLSESDLLFSLLYKKVKKVDCFDINPITYRYYYLRKWLLQYGIIDAEGHTLNELQWIVNRVNPSFKTEEESKLFWLHSLKMINNYHFYSNILFEYVPTPSVPYSENLSDVAQILKTMDLIFDNIDICLNICIDSNRKYDMVFMSNILNYNRTLEKLEIVCQNLINLLRSNGSVICVNMPNRSSLEEEKSIFSKYFDFSEIFKGDNLYYKYTLK